MALLLLCVLTGTRSETKTKGGINVMIGIFINKGGRANFAYKVGSGEKKAETRNSDTLQRFIGKRFDIIETGRGSAKIIGRATIESAFFCSSSDFHKAENQALHLVPVGSKFDAKESGKWMYIIKDPVLLDKPIPLPSSAIRHGRIWCEY